MFDEKKMLGAFIVSINMLILSIIIMASRICYYLDALDGTYTTDPIFYVPKEAIVLYLISIAIEAFVLLKPASHK